MDWRYIGPQLYDGCLFFFFLFFSFSLCRFCCCPNEAKTTFCLFSCANMFCFCLCQFDALWICVFIYFYIDPIAWEPYFYLADIYSMNLRARKSLTHCFCVWNVNCNDTPKKKRYTQAKKGMRRFFLLSFSLLLIWVWGKTLRSTSRI